MHTQTKTSPRRQYIATGIFAIIAMISGLSVLSTKNWAQSTLSAQTMSVQEQPTDNGHSQSIQFLEQQAENR